MNYRKVYQLWFEVVCSQSVLYLNNRVFLSRNYRLIVAPRKFDVLKTNICPRSEASRANMLVLRKSNFQGATIRPIVPRHKHYCLYCSLFFCTLIQKSIRIQLDYFQDFEKKAVKAKYKIWKRKQAKALNTISVVYFLRNPLVYRKIFTDDYYPSGYFRRTSTI